MKSKTPFKEHIIGNTKIIVHSQLVLMTDEERAQWFKDEWKKGNPILKQIADAVNACYTNEKAHPRQ